MIPCASRLHPFAGVVCNGHDQAVEGTQRMPQSHWNHFITQAWQRQFSSNGTTVWAYDHRYGSFRDRSPKSIMAATDLYTDDPNSPTLDTTLEDSNLNSIDDPGARALAAIVANSNPPTDTRATLARFFAVGMVRIPGMLSKYADELRSVCTRLIDAPSDSDADAFNSRMRRETGLSTFALDQKDFQTVQKALAGVSPADREAWALQVIDLCQNDSQAPATDLIRSHLGGGVIEKRLLQMEWTVKISNSPDYVLGDTGVLYDDQGGGQAGEAVRVPLSKTHGLWITRSSAATPRTDIVYCAARQFEVNEMALEAAAHAQTWFVAENEARLRWAVRQTGGQA